MSGERSVAHRRRTGSLPRPSRIEELLGASAGTEIERPVDLIVTDDWTTPALLAPLAELGTVRAAAPVVLVRDHTAPVENYTGADAARVRSLRQVEEEFVARFGARSVTGRGIQHHVIPHSGLLEPGMLVLGNDSHTPTLGAFGVAAFAAQPSTIAVAIHTGKFVTRVPDTLRISVVGRLRGGVTMRDAALTLLGLLRAGGEHPRLATGKALEFSGPGLGTLSASERAVLANVVPEAVAVTAPFEHPATAARGHEWAAAELTLDLSTVVPAVARNGRPTDVVPLDDLASVNIDRVFVGTCAGGTFEEISAFADALGGSACVPTVVAPASADVSSRLEAEGVRARLEAAGVTVLPPGCGPCFGFGFRLEAGEVAAVTGNRNGIGRMGSPEAQILLVSGATAGHAARTGVLGAAARTAAAGAARPTITWPTTGNVVRLHGAVSTDDLTPSSVPGIGTSSDPDPHVSRRLLLHHIDATAADRDLLGSVIVADENFGMGSNRASSVRALITAGVSAVVARSIAPLYRLGARDEGLLTLVVDDDAFYTAATPTATVRYDARQGRVTVEGHSDASSGTLEFLTTPASEYELALRAAGGAVAYLRAGNEPTREPLRPVNGRPVDARIGGLLAVGSHEKEDSAAPRA